MSLIASSSGPAEDRVAMAYAEKGARVKAMCAKAGVKYPPKKLFLRAFKRERVLEVWASNGGSAAFRKVASYPVAAASGDLGPKRVQGDQQVPEGFYVVDRFNPKSLFWLSLGLNYPNASDRVLSDRQRPGADIFIHGNCVSIGCLAMNDDAIKEIYLLALEAHKAGQKGLPVHIFPFRMTAQATLEAARSYPQWANFWSQLKPGYDAFERTRRVPQVRVLKDGSYQLVRR
jgi:murein L,D-transpeptidase YafK